MQHHCTVEDTNLPIVVEFTNRDGLVLGSRWNSDSWYETETKTAYLKLRIVDPDGREESPIAYWHAGQELELENPNGEYRRMPLSGQNGMDPLYYINTKDVFAFVFRPEQAVSCSVDINAEFAIPVGSGVGRIEKLEIFETGVIWYYAGGEGGQPHSEEAASIQSALWKHTEDSALLMADGTEIQLPIADTVPGMADGLYTYNCHLTNHLNPENVIGVRIGDSTYYKGA